MTMPGLPKIPAAENIDIDDCGNIVRNILRTIISKNNLYNNIKYGNNYKDENNL